MRSAAAPLDRAFQLLDTGDLDGALRVLDGALAAAEQAQGPASLAVARAHNDKGMLLRFVGDDEGALRCFERAVELTAGDDERQREHLTFLLNVGDVLSRSGTLVDAEDAIRRSLNGRRALYGPSHPGYAFALEPLAQVLLRQRKLDLALEAAEEATANFRHHGHPRLATALAVRAEILASAGADTRTLAGAEELPDELLPALVQALEGRLVDGDPHVLARVLYELVPVLEARLGAAHDVTLQAWSAIANVEASGDPEKRRAALTRIREALDGAGDGPGALEAQLGLALAFVDEGDFARADETYAEAVRRATALEDDSALAQVLRNQGVFLEDSGDKGGARRALTGSVEAAARSGDELLEGRCQAALGVMLAHSGTTEEARGVLEAALAKLPEDHSDALVVRAHLDALASGSECGCGEGDVALAQALKELVKGRVPKGLVGDVRLVTGDDDELSVDVQLLREASPREQELLDEVVRAAHRRLRERVLRGG